MLDLSNNFEGLTMVISCKVCNILQVCALFCFLKSKKKVLLCKCMNTRVICLNVAYLLILTIYFTLHLNTHQYSLRALEAQGYYCNILCLYPVRTYQLQGTILDTLKFKLQKQNQGLKKFLIINKYVCQREKGLKSEIETKIQ